MEEGEKGKEKQQKETREEEIKERKSKAMKTEMKKKNENEAVHTNRNHANISNQCMRTHRWPFGPCSKIDLLKQQDTTPSSGVLIRNYKTIRWHDLTRS